MSQHWPPVYAWFSLSPQNMCLSVEKHPRHKEERTLSALWCMRIVDLRGARPIWRVRRGVCRWGFPGRVDVATARGSSAVSLVALLEDELSVFLQSDCGSLHWCGQRLFMGMYRHGRFAPECVFPLRPAAELWPCSENKVLRLQEFQFWVSTHSQLHLSWSPRSWCPRKSVKYYNSEVIAFVCSFFQYIGS